MTIETITITDHTPVDVWGHIKRNPLWLLGGPDGFTAPAWNTDTSQGTYQYMPEEKRQWVRDFYWWFRNPAMNYVAFGAGVEAINGYKITGTAPVIKTTPRDETPPLTGWKWAVSRTGFSWVALLFFFAAAAITWAIAPPFIWTWLVGVPWLWALPVIVLKFLWLVAYIAWIWLFGMPGLLRAWGILPYVAYWNPTLFGDRGLELYHGWRPNSGGYGSKLTLPKVVT